MARTRKPDPNIMTKEDYDLYSRLYEEKKSKKEIQEALDESNRKTAEKEKQRNIEYKKEQERITLENQKIYHRKTEPTPTPAITTEKAVTTEKTGGWQNVWEVMKITLNPFSEGKIVATTDNRIFNTAAEYIANNPYLTALIMASGVGLWKGAVAKVGTVGKVYKPITVADFTIGGSTASLYSVNTYTAKVTGTMLAKIMAQMKKPAYVLAAIGASIGTYPWAEWSTTEAQEIMGFTTKNAVNTGDPELIQQVRETYNEIYDPNVWEQIGRLIPFANIAVGFNKKFKALASQKIVNDKILADEIIKINTGETEDVKWARIKKEEADQETAAVDYYNSERKKMLEWEQEAYEKQNQRRLEQEEERKEFELEHTERELELYEESRKKQREAEELQRTKDAEFWRKEREKQREAEAKDRQAIADFWIAYRKQLQKLREESSPSQLNFGLL